MHSMRTANSREAPRPQTVEDECIKTDAVRQEVLVRAPTFAGQMVARYIGEKMIEAYVVKRVDGDSSRRSR
jgi:hypothetical protein